MSGSMRWSAICLSGLAWLSLGCRTATPPRAADSPTAPTGVSEPQARSPEGVEVKLDGQLIAVVRAYRRGGDVAAKALARTERVATVADRLRVGVTVADKNDMDSLRTRIAELGGEVTVEFGNRLYALLPVAALESLAEEERVWSIATPRKVASPLELQ